MPHPSSESSNVILDSIEPVTERVYRTASESSQAESMLAPRPREDDIASPVCAACWAY